MKLYQRISELLTARKNCETSGNTEWHRRHTEHLLSLVKKHMPSGGGFDQGTTIDLNLSKPNKIDFDTSFHHMDGNGGYDGRTDHSVTITPDFVSQINLRITGRNRNGIKEYIHEVFSDVLTREVDE